MTPLMNIRPLVFYGVPHSHTGYDGLKRIDRSLSGSGRKALPPTIQLGLIMKQDLRHFADNLLHGNPKQSLGSSIETGNDPGCCGRHDRRGINLTDAIFDHLGLRLAAATVIGLTFLRLTDDPWGWDPLLHVPLPEAASYSSHINDGRWATMECVFYAACFCSADCHPTNQTPARMRTIPATSRTPITSPKTGADRSSAETGMRLTNTPAREGPTP